MIEVHGLILFNAFSKILSKIHFMGIACTFFWGWCEQMEGQRTRKRKKDWLHTSWVFRCLLIVHRSWDYISWPYAAKNPFALTFSNTMKERWWWWLTETPWQKSWRSRSIWRCLGRCLRGDVWRCLEHWKTMAFSHASDLDLATRRSLPWQTVFCFLAWLDFVRRAKNDVRRQCSQCPKHSLHMDMGQYLLIPFLVGWTSIYQLFWCELQGYKVLTHCHMST